MIEKQLFALVLIAVFSPITFAQTANEPVTLRAEVMRQVVNRIVRWQFRPARKPRTVPIADVGIKREWLPPIKNISFDLVPENRINDFEKGVFLFEDVTREGRVYSINVGWGDLDCNGGGDTWKFTVRNSRVRLWPAGGWGRGCSGGDPPVILHLKLGDISPNELPGYEFFAKGKLKKIRLGISTREDITRLFGSPCEGECNYDENWTIFVNYFEEDAVATQTTYLDDRKSEIELVPKPEVVGTIRSVALRPKKRISFLGVFFPRRFAKGSSHTVGDSWDENGFAGAVHSTSDTYTDGYGLEYSVFDKETFNNLRDKESRESSIQKGDLLAIEYTLPESLDDKISQTPETLGFLHHPSQPL